MVLDRGDLLLELLILLLEIGLKHVLVGLLLLLDADLIFQLVDLLGHALELLLQLSDFLTVPSSVNHACAELHKPAEIGEHEAGSCALPASTHLTVETMLNVTQCTTNLTSRKLRRLAETPEPGISR